MYKYVWTPSAAGLKGFTYTETEPLGLERVSFGIQVEPQFGFTYEQILEIARTTGVMQLVPASIVGG